MQHKTIVSAKFNNIILFISIILFCFFISLANSMFSNNIDEALIISGKINLPETYSPQIESLNNSKSLIIYFIIFLIKLGFSNYAISNILLFISTIFFFTGIFLVLKNLLSFILKRYTYIIAFLSTCLFILSDTHLPHTDYPNAFFASFTAGLYSIAISTLIFGLIIQGKNKLALFFAILLFLIHPVQGIWILSILIILELIEKFFIKKNHSILNYRFSLSVIIILFSSIFLSFLNQKTNIDFDLIDLWVKNWDYHRNNLDIRLSYLKPSVLLIVLSILCFFTFKKKKMNSIIDFIFLQFNNIFINYCLFKL